MRKRRERRGQHLTRANEGGSARGGGFSPLQVADARSCDVASGAVGRSRCVEVALKGGWNTSAGARCGAWWGWSLRTTAKECKLYENALRVRRRRGGVRISPAPKAGVMRRCGASHKTRDEGTSLPDWHSACGLLRTTACNERWRTGRRR